MVNSLATFGVLSSSILVSGTSSAALIAYEFNTAGDTEGWNASAAPDPNGVVTGFQSAPGIDGLTGVLTSEDINIDPQLTKGGPAATLPAGDTWANMTIRFRHLSGNPDEVGVTSMAYSVTGTLLFFNGTLQNRTPGETGISTQSYVGTGAYAADTYNMTVIAGDDDWQVMTLDLSGAPVLNSGDITTLRFDPVGNAAGKNFEVDYVRFQSIPEPTSVLLSLLGGLGLLVRRR
ncbi:PEP-CTERM sorting domain-containing protein [Verrucomicrobiaceae bacterium 227]